MADVQTEKAYQKQPTIFQNKKRVLAADGGKEAKERIPRYHKNVGLGFKTPREMKMQRTVVIRRDYLHYIRKYNRFEKRHKNMSVHLSPAFRDVTVGDIVTVGECRPLSKTVRFNVLKVTKAAGAKKQFQKDVTVGDIVTVGECRPLSKTVRFNVLKVTKAAGAKKQFQKF
ncbi:hypothetical protein CRUP_028642 [Coryphaenoides rupestris]|nr:hypothetical protein CRUP_028642 [Coryphaenoides rupestris]